MTVTASDVMITPHMTLLPELSLPDAFSRFVEASSVEGELQGMIVVDSDEKLVGVLSMYDVFLSFVPKNIQVWGNMEDIDFYELMEKSYDKIKNVCVADVMTREPISITPSTPLLSILDLIIKKHIRKIPVVENDKVVGLIYAANVFYHLVNRVKK